MIIHHKPYKHKSCQTTAHYLAEASLFSFPLPVVLPALYDCLRARALSESEEASAEERVIFIYWLSTWEVETSKYRIKRDRGQQTCYDFLVVFK